MLRAWKKGNNSRAFHSFHDANPHEKYSKYIGSWKIGVSQQQSTDPFLICHDS